MTPDGSPWILMNTNEYKWIPMDLNGFKWIPKDPNEFKRIVVNLKGSQFIKIDQNGSK